MTARVECAEAMRQALLQLHNDHEQLLFSAYLKDVLEEMKVTTAEVLAATSTFVSIGSLLTGGQTDVTCALMFVNKHAGARTSRLHMDCLGTVSRGRPCKM